MTHRALAPLMIGRQAQLRALSAHMAAAQSGSGRLVLIAGDAGVGKTRLIREFTRSLPPGAEVDVLEGHCYDDQPAPPLGPFAELVQLLAQSQEPHALAQAAGPWAGELAQLWPELAPPQPRAPEGEPQIEKRRMFEAIYRVLRPQAAQGCRVVVIEDLHWSDQISQELLLSLARTIEHDRVLLVASYRTDELHRRHPLSHLLAQLSRERLAHELRLAPLLRDEFAELLESTLGRRLPAMFIDALYERTEGNPFFGEEVLESLIEHGQIDTLIEQAQSVRRLDGMAIPLSIRDSLLQRTADLDPATATAVRYAAVIGCSFDFELLLRVTGLEEAALIRSLAALVERQLIVELPGPDDRYRFRHELIRETIYEDLLRRERRIKHREVLQALEAIADRRHDRVAQLAYHSLQARALPQAAHYARLAGDRSMTLHAYREASDHYEAALELDEHSDPSAPATPAAHATRAALLTQLGHAAYPIGDLTRAARHWHAAQELYQQLGETRRVADLSRMLGNVAWELDDSEAAFAHTRAALAALAGEPPCPELAMAQSALSRLYMLTSQYRESIEWGQRALALAEQVDDAAVRSHALNNIGVALVELGEYERGIAKLEQSLEIAQQRGLLADSIRGYSNLGGMLGKVGRYGEAMAAFERGAAYAANVGWELPRTALLQKLAWAETALGRWDAAEAHLDQALRQGVALTPSERGEIDQNRAVILAQRGRADEARALLSAPRAEIASRHDCVKANVLYVQAYLLLGDIDQAHEAAEQGLRYWSTTGGMPATAYMLRPYVEALILAGKPDQAAGLLAELAGQRVVPSPSDLADLADLRGLLALQLGQDAAGHFSEAAERWQALGLPFEEARARRRLAESLMQSGAAREEAQRQIGAARRLAETLGAAPELEALDALARRVGARRTGEPDRPGGLTRRELQVLALIARGHTNRAIAEELVISEKTAEVHVSNILGKLGLASRTQAAAYAVEHELA